MRIYKLFIQTNTRLSLVAENTKNLEKKMAENIQIIDRKIAIDRCIFSPYEENLLHLDSSY